MLKPAELKGPPIQESCSEKRQLSESVKIGQVPKRYTRSTLLRTERTKQKSSTTISARKENFGFVGTSLTPCWLAGWLASHDGQSVLLYREREREIVVSSK